MFCGIKLDIWSHPIPQIRWFKPQKLFSHNCGGLKSEIKMPVGLLFLRPLFLVHRWPSSPCVFSFVSVF